MLTESALVLELHKNGKQELHEVQADRALVGSGAHCDVRLPPDQAAVEQLLIEARDEEIFVKVCAFEPPCRLNGAPFLEARLSPDSVIELGKLALRVRLGELKQANKPAKKVVSQSHPAVQALGLIGVAAGLYFVLDTPPEEESALTRAATPPALFGEAGPDCPHGDPAAARSQAMQDHMDAENKRERSPFYARDGLLAVPLYERAAACYERAGLSELARETRSAAGNLKRRMADELHVRHVRIERFIAQEKFEPLRRELRLASEFVQDRSHPYAHWLAAVARETEVRTKTEAEK